MQKVKIIALGAGLAIAAGGVTAYIIRENGMANIDSVTPLMLTKKIPYQECGERRRTTYSRPGDKYNLVGGIGGGVGGALVAHAFTSNPVILAGGAVAGVLGGQAIERHVKKPTAHTTEGQYCETKYKTSQVLGGYVVNYRYKDETGSRVVGTLPESDKIPLAEIESAPTPQQVIAQNQAQNDNND